MFQNDYFDRQKIIGKKISSILAERNLTKTSICNETGISKPTFDKFLNGDLPNKVFYEKYVIRLMEVLNLSDADLFDNVKNEYVQMQAIMEYQDISFGQMAEMTGISSARLQEIDRGMDATKPELRDIAVSLNTSVSSLLGENFFDAYVATYSFEKRSEEFPRIGGYWGHIGLLLQGMDKYIWQPISSSVLWKIRGGLKKEWVIIPCINNRLLIVKSRCVRELNLLDDACDEPYWSGCELEDRCIAIPHVFYEAIEDYLYETEREEYFSDEFLKLFERVFAGVELDEEAMSNIMRHADVYYTDGRKTDMRIDYDVDDEVTEFVHSIYSFGDYIGDDSFLEYTDTNEADAFVNLDAVAMFDLPLCMMEKMLWEWEKEV